MVHGDKEVKRVKKILVAGLPGSGVSLITKMLAKCLVKRHSKVIIQDLSVSGKIFATFALGETDELLGITDYDGMDITKDLNIAGNYDVCITEATICESILTSSACNDFDEVIIIGSEDAGRMRRIEQFIMTNDLQDIKMIVNLACLGKFEYEKDRIDYLSFLSMDPSVLEVDVTGSQRGKILFTKMPKAFRKQIEALCDEVYLQKEITNRLFKKLGRNSKKEEKGQIHAEG